LQLRALCTGTQLEEKYSDRGHSMAHKKMTMGLIVGNRGFFPDHLAKSGREEMICVLEAANIDVLALTPEQSKYGAVETREESKRCSDLFRQHRDRIDGIVVTLPNFGEERAIADTLRLAELRVPVLIQATPDDPRKMTIAFRRDSFCGKMSACNNLSQYGIPYSITTLHTESPDSPEFAKDLQWFAAVCRVVTDFGTLEWDRSELARPLLTLSDTARRFWNRRVFPSRRSTFRTCLGASSA
jgi:L-fucose isomerase-like protein